MLRVFDHERVYGESAKPLRGRTGNHSNLIKCITRCNRFLQGHFAYRNGRPTALALRSLDILNSAISERNARQTFLQWIEEQDEKGIDVGQALRSLATTDPQEKHGLTT